MKCICSENPQVTESLWRDDDEDPRTEVRVTTPPTIVKIITAAPEYRNTYKYVDYTRGKTNKKYRGNVLRYKYVCWGQLLCYNLYQAYHPYMDSAHSKDCLMPFKLGLSCIHDE